MEDRLMTSPEHELLVALCESHLKSVLNMEGAIFDRLLCAGELTPIHLAELFEDAANVYLSASEEISRQWCEARLSEHASSPRMESPEPVSG